MKKIEPSDKLPEGYEQPFPGSMKRVTKNEIFFYPIIRQMIFGNKMRTALNTPCTTRDKARWMAYKHIKNLT